MNAQFGSLQDFFASSKSPLVKSSGMSKRTYRLAIYALMISVDILAIVSGFLISNILLLDNVFASPGLKLCFLSVPVFLVVALQNHAYGKRALYRKTHGASRSIIALIATLGLITFILFGLEILKPHHPAFIATGLMSSAVLIGVGRQLCHMFASKLLGASPINELIIVDGVPHAEMKGQNIVNAQYAGIQPDTSCPHMLDRLGNLFRSADRVVVACSEHAHDDWTLVLKSTGIEGEVHRNFASASALPSAIISLDPSQLKPLAPDQLFIKRSFDVVCAVLALAFLMPLMLLTALAIKLESEGPVLFKQQRLGHGSRLFHIYKFRSMRTEQSDATGDVSTMRDDDRITRVGKFIRKTSIDELPQLFNVLEGSMSLVGPRPHALGSKADSKLFWEIDRNYWLRHATIPGLTGLAQVRGFRGATMEQADLENRLASDLEYIQSWSVMLDLQILARTFGVLFHRNAF